MFGESDYNVYQGIYHRYVVLRKEERTEQNGTEKEKKTRGERQEKEMERKGKREEKRVTV